MSSSRSSPAGSHRGQRGTVGPHVRRRPAPHVLRDRTVHLEGFGISELGFCNSQVVDLFWGGGVGVAWFFGVFSFFFFSRRPGCAPRGPRGAGNRLGLPVASRAPRHRARGLRPPAPLHAAQSIFVPDSPPTPDSQAHRTPAGGGGGVQFCVKQRLNGQFLSRSEL